MDELLSMAPIALDGEASIGYSLQPVWSRADHRLRRDMDSSAASTTFRRARDRQRDVPERLRDQVVAGDGTLAVHRSATTVLEAMPK